MSDNNNTSPKAEPGTSLPYNMTPIEKQGLPSRRLSGEEVLHARLETAIATIAGDIVHLANPPISERAAALTAVKNVLREKTAGDPERRQALMDITALKRDDRQGEVTELTQILSADFNREVAQIEKEGMGRGGR